jgi:hypothetical protein
MNRIEAFFYPRPAHVGVATKRIARFPQRMAAALSPTLPQRGREQSFPLPLGEGLGEGWLRLGMEQPFLVVAPCPAQRATHTALRLTTDSRFNREKAAA